MSLASTQAAIDTAMSTLLANIDAAQATYYASNGRYWQGLISHLTIPDNGSSILANNLSATPTDQVVTWDTFMGANKPGTIPASVTVDVYQTQTGAWGYVKRVLFVYQGAIYSTATDSGADPANNVPWGSTPDPQTPPYLQSVATAIVGNGSDVSGVGTLTWSNPGNITQNDGSYAGMDMTGVAATSHWLLGKALGFTFPDNTVIDGIKATVRRVADASASHDFLQDQTVKLFLSGAAIGNNKAAAGNVPTTIESKVYGGTTDLWGTNLTPANLTDSTFGLGVSWSGEEATGQVDYIQFDVSYTADAARAFPTITSLSQTTGTIAGGTSVTVTGTGFKSGISGTLGGNALTLTYTSSTSISFSTPAHAAGAVDLVLTNCDGKGVTSSNAFTYANTIPQYVRNGSGTASSTGPVTLTWSGGTAPTVGNLMIAIIQNNSGGSVTSSNGWTQLNSGLNSTTCWYKVATVSDTSTAAWNWGGSAKADKCQGLMIEISGNAASPIDANAASTSTFTTPSVTTTTGTLVVSLGGGGTTTNFETQPSGWTLALHGSTHNGTGIAYKEFASSGATGTANWNNAGGENKVFTVAVKA